VLELDAAIAAPVPAPEARDAGTPGKAFVQARRPPKSEPVKPARPPDEADEQWAPVEKVLVKWFPASQMPAARARLVDTCANMFAIGEAEGNAMYNARADGGTIDREAFSQAMRERSSLMADAVQSLLKLPGSMFNHKAMQELLEMPEFGAVCPSVAMTYAD